jgi:PRTRC genetic system protein C
MLSKTVLPRIFIHTINNQSVRLADPSYKWSKEQVRNYYANTYPILTTATIEGPEMVNDEMQYRFRSDLGTKG